MVSTNDAVSPPPLPPPLPIETQSSVSVPPSSSYSYNPSLIIIAAILAFVCIASASIHLLLRFLSLSLSSSSSSSPPLINRNTSSNSAATSTSSASSSSNTDPKSLLDSLPLFTLASSLATLPKSSPDCAVCLSRFQPHDELRLLPACRHAFHSPCIDTWLRTTPSCPLCRSSIDLLPPPPPPPPPAVADDQSSTSDSFRLEIGSVSHRSGAATPPPPPPQHERSYSLGSSIEYPVEEVVDAVIARVLGRTDGGKDGHPAAVPPPQGMEVADAAGGGGSKGWLRDYVDRLASSASSSFSSLRFSSRRFDVNGGGGGRGGSWDLENDGNGEEGRLSASYRWLTGAPW